ncbi:MAG: hypothetical protein AAFR60_02615, partial [Pseudomonadota bacterium]
HRVLPDGTITTEPDTRPLSADARQHADGWDNAVLKVAAHILGCDMKELYDRHRIAQQRRIAVGVAVGIALFGSLGAAAHYGPAYYTEALRADVTSAVTVAVLADLDAGPQRELLDIPASECEKRQHAKLKVDRVKLDNVLETRQREMVKARTLFGFAECRRKNGDLDIQIELAKHAGQLFRKWAEDTQPTPDSLSDGNAAHRMYGRALYELGAGLKANGNVSEALETFDKLVAHRRSLLKTDSNDKLRDEVSSAIYARAKLYVVTGEHERAHDDFTEATELRAQLFKRNRGSQRAMRRWTSVRLEHARLRALEGDLATARQIIGEVRRHRFTSLDDRYPTRGGPGRGSRLALRSDDRQAARYAAWSELYLANTELRSGLTSRALERLINAERVFVWLARARERSRRYDEDVAWARLSLGRGQLVTGNLAQALSMFDASAETFAYLAGLADPNDPLIKSNSALRDYAYVLYFRAKAHSAAQNWDEARRDTNIAIAQFDKFTLDPAHVMWRTELASLRKLDAWLHESSRNAGVEQLSRARGIYAQAHADYGSALNVAFIPAWAAVRSWLEKRIDTLDERLANWGGAPSTPPTVRMDIGPDACRGAQADPPLARAHPPETLPPRMTTRPEPVTCGPQSAPDSSGVISHRAPPQTSTSAISTGSIPSSSRTRH